MTQAQLGELSDSLVIASTVVYGLALLLHALEAALRHRPRQLTVSAARLSTPVLVGAHGAVTAGGPEGRAHEDGAQAGAQAGAARIGRIALSITVLGFVLHLAGVLARAASAGRVPWGNMYEFAITGALATTGAYLLLRRRWAAVRDLGVWIQALVLLSLGLATTVLYTPTGDLVPALDSVWLVVHVVSAVVSGGIFTVGAVAATVLLVRSRRSAAKVAPQQRPDLERLVHVTHLFAFPLWTFAVIAGAIWAENAWGRYWGWDPKETWAFITWVLYAAYLHAESTAGWSGRRAAWFAVSGYLAFLFNYFGVNLWITGLHSYAGV